MRNDRLRIPQTIQSLPNVLQHSASGHLGMSYIFYIAKSNV